MKVIKKNEHKYDFNMHAKEINVQMGLYQRGPLVPTPLFVEAPSDLASLGSAAEVIGPAEEWTGENLLTWCVPWG